MACRILTRRRLAAFLMGLACVPSLTSLSHAEYRRMQGNCNCACDNGCETSDGDMSQGEEAPSTNLNIDETFAAFTGSDFAVTDGMNLAPNMIGDFFGGGYYIDDNLSSSHSHVPPAVPIAAGDRRFKISENSSPLTRDRVYFSYNQFQNVVRTIDGQELNLYRYTFGGEKTFFDGLASVELRTPFANGLSSTQNFDGDLDNDQATEFGNISVIPKVVLLSTDAFLLSGGLGVNLPTADDATVQDGSDVAIIKNDAVHLMPFLGFLAAQNQAYAIGYMQTDFDLNGNEVYIGSTGGGGGGGGPIEGKLQDAALMHLDLAMGYWIYRNDYQFISGIAPQLEMHYTTTMQDQDEGVGGLIGPITRRVDILTMTGGVNFQIFDASALTLGCAVPLRNDDARPEEHQFDAELQVLFNRFF